MRASGQPSEYGLSVAAPLSEALHVGLSMIEVTSSPASPFVRKVRITAAVKGLGGKVEFLDPEADAKRAEALRASNPLAKIPTAKLDDGTLIYDSHVICEYLDSLAPTPVLFPASGRARFDTLTLAALADGISDAAILIVYEGRFRPKEKWHQEWVDRQQAKIDAAVDLLESKSPDWKTAPDYGHITLACALGFMDLRLAGKWRTGHPRLTAWLDRFAAATPSFAATAPPKA